MFKGTDNGVITYSLPVARSTSLISQSLIQIPTKEILSPLEGILSPQSGS